MARLDALKGLERSSIAPRFRPPDFCAERQFASPIQTVEAIEVQLRKLADDLVVLLERQAKGARRIELSLYRVDGAVRRIRIGASRPLNEARAIVRLIAERLASPNEDAIDAGYGVDLMRLACLTAEPLAPSEAELERAHEAERARSLAELLDRLSARLGARAVTRRELVDAHLPEQAETAAPATLGEARLRSERVVIPRSAATKPSRSGSAGPWIASPQSVRKDGRLSTPYGSHDGQTRAGAAVAPFRPPGADRGAGRSARRASFRVSAGGEFCMMSRPSRGRSASPRPGGDMPTCRRATISAPRILKAAASGFIARAYGAGRRCRPKWFVHGLFG